MFRRKFQARRRMTREEKAAEELEWRRINEEIELSAEGVEPLLGAYSGYSVEVTAMLIFPFLNMFMMWFPMVRRGVRASTLGRWRLATASVPHAGDADHDQVRHLDVHVEVLHLRALLTALPIDSGCFYPEHAGARLRLEGV